MTARTAHVWVMTPGDELVRSDLLVWLRCRSGHVEAARPDGTVVLLAGPGCPPGFHIDLLRELESHSRWHDDRWTIIITAEITPGVCRWASARLDELAEISGLSD